MSLIFPNGPYITHYFLYVQRTEEGREAQEILQYRTSGRNS